MPGWSKPTLRSGRSRPGRERVRQQNYRFWTPEQLRCFLRLVEGHRLETAWHVSAITGMRRGEVLGLRWADVDLGSGRIHVRQALVSVAYELVGSRPKNHQARVIDLDPRTIEHLRGHRRRQLDERTEWGSDYQDGDLVFCKEDGQPLHPQTYTQAFERLIARSELPKIRLHDLRHTHATIALPAGVPPKVIPGMQADAALAVANLVSANRQDP